MVGAGDQPRLQPPLLAGCTAASRDAGRCCGRRCSAPVSSRTTSTSWRAEAIGPEGQRRGELARAAYMDPVALPDRGEVALELLRRRNRRGWASVGSAAAARCTAASMLDWRSCSSLPHRERTPATGRLSIAPRRVAGIDDSDGAGTIVLICAHCDEISGDSPGANDGRYSDSANPRDDAPSARPMRSTGSTSSASASTIWWRCSPSCRGSSAGPG